MEELMPLIVKILLAAAVVTTALGAAALAPYPWHQVAAPVAEKAPRPATPVGPSKDDPLKADPSWIRAPSLTDF
jgi:hypothetical protein